MTNLRVPNRLGWWCLLLGILLSNHGVQAAPKVVKGDVIYRQQCAKCHGAKGEGVKGKYDEALYGDWSMEKMVRYISKSMPEDKPGSCTGPHAEAVAKYINDAFYSKEARARNNPARVELVRLTNRQYLNTVADLMRHFLPDEGRRTNERGLAGQYSSSRRGNGEGTNRLERQIQFDFGTNNPAWAPNTTNGFNMTWRGSLWADETGDYEIMVKTQNGLRLWLNQEGEREGEKPFIDGGVAAATVNEHRATVRLIGGRAYPIRIDFFKAARDKGASVAVHWKPPHGVMTLIPALNLSPDRVAPTFVAATPFPADDSSVGYERGVSVSDEWDEAVTHAAIEAANYVAKNLNRLTKTKPEQPERAAKVEAFCREFVETAFRRPLTEEQARLFVKLPLSKAPNMEDGVKRVVLLALKSPRFLYLGLEDAKPDDYVVAQRLAFGLWDSLPDRELMKQAALGQLRTREQVQQQAQRMLGDPRARAKMQEFFAQWLHMNRVENLAKDDKLFPDFSPEIIADLRASLNEFLKDAMWNGGSDYRKLLLADYLFVNERMAKYYGIPAPATNDFVKVALNPKERSGVLTHPYLLAEFSYQRTSSPIHRGVFLTRNIVGRILKAPPVAVAFKDAEFPPSLTMREKITELTRSDNCQTCHSVINPLGFTLENYDAVGRFRTTENGKPIDVAAEYLTDAGEAVKLSGPRDVAQFAAGSETAQSGFVEQLFNQVVKQPMQAYGPDTAQRLRASFAAADFNMQKLLVEIATVAAVHGVEIPVKQAANKKKT